MVESGWPNAESVQSASIIIRAVNTPYQLPSMPIPDGMAVIIKSWPSNGGFIYVAASRPEVLDINRVYPLQPGEFIGYKVRNANSLWISGTLVNDLVIITAEINLAR